jgi:hypothetical protein
LTSPPVLSFRSLSDPAMAAATMSVDEKLEKLRAEVAKLDQIR